jgi:glutamate carboxypeptidase
MKQFVLEKSLDAVTVKRVLDEAALVGEPLIENVRELVEIESPSGDEAGNRAVVDRLAVMVRDLGIAEDVELIEAPGFGYHLRFATRSAKAPDARPVLVLGHTDTVHSRGTLAQRPVHIDDGRMYGPGVFDMKANCVLALEAIRIASLLSTEEGPEVVVLFTCDEEVGSALGRPFVEEAARTARAVLVLEPPATGGIVKTGRKGTGVFQVEAHGIAAHAGLEPEKGASAILEIARQIERLHSLTDFSSGTTVNVGVVNGGTRPNVVAEAASAEVDIRFTSLAEGMRVEREILASRPFDPRVTLNIKGGVNRPPLERNSGTERLFNLAASVATSLGFDLRETQVGGASDGNFAAATGAIVLDGLGVDGDGAHASHEHIILSDAPRRLAFLAGLIHACQKQL